MHSADKIYVAGHRGLVGSAIVRRLRSLGHSNLVFASRSEVDLAQNVQVNQFFADQKPQYVFVAAAKVGGILANDTYPADFLRDNLAIELNMIEACHLHAVTKVQFLGSSCIYPKLCPQPIKEEYLLTGPLEPTNEWYAVAKIAGIKLAQAYRRQFNLDATSLMPTNLYGPGDNFHPTGSHVIPALIRKFHEAKVSGQESVTVWGTGRPRREFLHVDDLASAAVFLMQNYSSSEIINVGVGEDVSIAELATLVGKVVGFGGEIQFDTTKPDGTPRKLLDVTRVNQLGWKASIPLEAGLTETYSWYVENLPALERI